MASQSKSSSNTPTSAQPTVTPESAQTPIDPRIGPPIRNRIIHDETPEIPTDVNKFVREQLEYWERHTLRDNSLYREFRLDFAKWTRQTFNLVATHLRKDLRIYLYDHG